MKSWYTLVHREFLEHRVAFVYAPAALVTALLAAIVVAAFSSTVSIDAGGFVPTPAMLYSGLLLIVVVLWTGYLLIALFFYFADSFSADRRNNAILFWRSMPQSDLKILTSKMLAGATIFPALILGWLLITSAIAYLATFVLAARVPEFAAPDIFTALGSWFQIIVAGIVFIILSLLWYAPFLAWVAGLSTAFRRWSIPLSFMIPAGVIVVEIILTYSGGEPGSAIGKFLSWRLSAFFGEDEVVPMLFADQPLSAPRLIADMLRAVDWAALVSGLVFAALVTWAASEYRRRQISA
jgi:ABC-2 type transport system permease protein